jgi:Uma2 family endonuclease
MRRPPGEELLTVDQFLWIPDFKPHLEFVAGRVVQKRAAGWDRARIQSEFIERLFGYGPTRELGRLATYVRCTFGAVSLVPDLCFIIHGRIPRGEDGRLDPDVQIAPDLLVEIDSPGYPPGELEQKLREAAEEGVRLSWLVEPRIERVTVIRPRIPLVILGPGDLLSGEDVLPGFALPLDELFGSLDEEF